MDATNPRLDTALTVWARLDHDRGPSPLARATHTLEASIFDAPTSLERDRPFPNLDAANRYAHEVTDTEGLPPAYVTRCPELTDTATAFTFMGRIAICVPAYRDACWTRVTVLHELAHVAVGADHGHDHTWADTYIGLVRGYLSPRAAHRFAAGYTLFADEPDWPCLSVEDVADLLVAA